MQYPSQAVAGSVGNYYRDADGLGFGEFTNYQMGVFDCLAVGSGFAYYSLSSILITELKEASLGVQMATELGTIALIANIIREIMALLGAPLFVKYFGRLAPYLCRRCHDDGYNITDYYALFRKGSGIRFYLSRHFGRFYGTVLCFFFCSM